MRITCDRCRMLNEVHIPERQRAMSLRDIIARMRHDGCGGGRRRAVTGIEAASSRPVRKILLLDG